MFKVIQGGLNQSNAIGQYDSERIRAEGQRRLREAGVEHYLAREKLTGIALPTTMRVFMLQVEFAVEALAKLSPIPVNILEDGYWPTYDRASPSEAALIRR